MNSNSNDLLNNFAEELKRRMSLVTEDGEYESKNVGMEEFITSSSYMDLSEDISQANMQLLKHVDNPEIREAWLILGKGSGKVLTVRFTSVEVFGKHVC